ncbi:arabinose ABC transporter permease [Corynebacterium sp. HMSC05H05]|uniref:MFS transporter n=1 Tax=Corynebacterium sp. HMSC05H05 TaxID=1581119 RepID=UPI0008A2CD6A|nr:MFS transporter [Corynebacterium sp. HMSC05H05]OFT57217.1 arabinose ABC transporter permease [Corynebacterium sp. HMSC05H05]
MNADNSTQHTPQQAPRTQPKIPRTIWVLVGAAFIIALGYGLIAPVLPQFAGSFGVSMAAAGAVISVFAMARLLGAPGAGRLVDKLGSRPIYLTGLLIVAGATFLVAFVNAYWQILALRFIAGFGSTMFTLSAQALIVRVTHPSIRGRANALYASAFLVGNVVGPIIGAALSFLGFRAPFVIYGLAVAGAAVAVGALTQPRPGSEPLPAAKPKMRVRQAWQTSTYKALLAAGFTNGFVNMGSRVAILPLFAAAVFERGGAAAGLALTAFAFGMAVTLQFSGRLADQLGRRPMVAAGLATSGVFTALLGGATSFWPLVLLSAAAGIGAGLMSPAAQATLADIIGNERSGGTVLSTYQMTQDAGSILAPVLLGAVAEAAGFQAAFGVCGAVCAATLVIWLVAGKETKP